MNTMIYFFFLNKVLLRLWALVFSNILSKDFLKRNNNSILKIIYCLDKWAELPKVVATYTISPGFKIELQT